jgi:hypothetical protein
MDSSNVYDPGLEDGWQRFPEPDPTPDPEDWDTTPATEQENYPSGDES